VKTIDEVSGVIKQISSIQTAIAGAVEQQTVTTQEIGRNLTEAARGTSEIARNIAGVAEAARNTSEGAHKTERTSNDLARAARQLNELVAQFKCD
jgi:methyl-accepting chemotaxis protein